MSDEDEGGGGPVIIDPKRVDTDICAAISKALAVVLDSPGTGRCKALAVTKLEEALMWAEKHQSIR